MAELLVVATPIGNLSDLSPRMAEALARADLIAAEDTRVTMKLLSHLGLQKPMVSCHQHNEVRRAPDLVRRMLSEDLTVALTTDAGTPAISDPGVELVRAAHQAGIRVTPVCGPSAAIAALSASGFDAREFAFYGFLPREKKQLRAKLGQMLMTGIPVAVVYESPHRVLELVREIARELPGSALSVSCDISKRYELILVGSCQDVLAKMSANPNVEKGEYVVVIDLSGVPRPEPKREQPSAELLIMAHVLDGLDLSQAAERALQSGLPRNEVYRAKLLIKKRLEAL